MKKNTRKGFTLIETAIAMALMTIIFSMSITAILVVSKTQKNNFETKYFALISNDYLECYKTGGKDNFETNVNNLLNIDLSVFASKMETEYTVSYDKDYYAVSYDADSSYHLIITIDENGFYLRVINKSGKTAYEMPSAYLSRFDMGGGV